MGRYKKDRPLSELPQSLFQYGVDNKTNEIGVVHEVLKNLVLEGRIVTMETMDALLTQREVAKDILDGGGEYVWRICNDSQREPGKASGWYDDVKTVFEGPYSHLLKKSSAQTLDMGHGRFIRIEERYIITLQ